MALTQDPLRYERLARHWLEKFIDETEPDLAEIAYAAGLLRDLDAGDELRTLEVLKPMLHVNLSRRK